jgi:phosphatidylglycerol:prolipoprotein diacylglycerol transferase
MLPYPEIDPVLLQVGPLQVRWYGLMYVLGFMASYLLVKQQLKQISFTQLQREFENLNIVLIISIVIGGRLGYVLFYNLGYYLEHPLEIPATWAGGMSFHGAAIGLIIGGLIFCRRKKIEYFKAADIYAVTIPIGLGLGRLGNFINGELFGRPSQLPWSMVFPGGGPIARHPSQLYEALCEGLLLFILLWSQRKKPWRNCGGTHGYWTHGALLALLLIGYGLLRVLIEFTREPDAQLGLYFGLFSMGQLLSAAMIAGGSILWVVLIQRGRDGS